MGTIRPKRLLKLLQEKVALKKQLILLKKTGDAKETKKLVAQITKIEKQLSSNTIRK
jgi:hypothetical protein